jgi:hypothetical protein
MMSFIYCIGSQMMTLCCQTVHKLLTGSQSHTTTTAGIISNEQEYLRSDLAH